MNNDLKIGQVELHDDGAKNLTVRLKLINKSTRTLHTYASVRALRYEPATRTLKVQLSDRGLRELGQHGTFIQPEFTSVDPNGETTIELLLPRKIARLKPEQNEIAPTVEELPAHEAQTLEIELAYAGTPFYQDERPGTGKSPRQMMIDWAEGHVKHRHNVSGSRRR